MMGKRLILMVFILAVVSFLLWGQARWGYAAKEERFWFIKIIDKIDQVLDNQKAILNEIKELKEIRKKAVSR